ncbi:MAG: chaperonin GroEL [Omnitrophica WOR_2 bacterium]
MNKYKNVPFADRVDLSNMALPGITSDSHKPPQEPPPRRPAVCLQPVTYDRLKRGTDFIANAIRPTLGPLPRLVVLEALQRQNRPEFLDDGATIARRIIQIKPRGSDVGAMLLRHALWKMHLEVGDGTATAAVMYQVILREGIRAITQYGSNAMLLRTGLEKGLKVVAEALRREAAPLQGKDIITQVARGMCQGDDEMADMLGEIFDIVGPEGLIVVEGGNTRHLEREYVEGTYWHVTGWFSRLFLPDPADIRIVFEDAALFISDMELKDPAQFVPVLEKCVKAGIKKLVIIAKDVSDAMIGLLVNNNQAKTIQTMAVRAPRFLEFDRVAAIEDIAILTGGKPIYAAARIPMEDIQVSDLGQARRAWATDSLFGIYGGKGDPRLIRQRILQVKGLLKNTAKKEEFEQSELQKRLGRLLGGTAILRVGGITQTEIETRKVIASRAVSGLRLAVRSGVVPGGGVTLYNAKSALAELKAENEDEATAYRILSRALEEPLRTIAKNAGIQPDVAAYQVQTAPKGCGLNARTGQIVDMRQAGIADSLLVLQKALETAVGGAAIALTTDVIVHRSKPTETVEP